MTYYNFTHGYGALGLVSCTDQLSKTFEDEANKVAEGKDSRFGSAAGREELAKIAANCYGAAVCAAMGGSASSELCGLVAEFIMGELIEVFNVMVDYFGGVFGSEDLKKKRDAVRNALLTASVKAVTEARGAITTQWGNALMRNVELYARLIKGETSLSQQRTNEYSKIVAMMFKAAGLDLIKSGDSYTVPYAMPPHCYPYIGCPGGSGSKDPMQKYKWVKPGETVYTVGTARPSGFSGMGTDWMQEAKEAYASWTGGGSSASSTVTSGTPIKCGDKNLPAVCPDDGWSNYFFLQKNGLAMQGYFDQLIRAEIKVMNSITHAAALKSAEELKNGQAAALVKLRARTAQYRKEREQREQREFWSIILGGPILSKLARFF